jgi:hypothetical protein
MRYDARVCGDVCGDGTRIQLRILFGDQTKSSTQRREGAEKAFDPQRLLHPLRLRVFALKDLNRCVIGINIQLFAFLATLRLIRSILIGLLV